MQKEYKAFGWWHVTTEGDCEGRTITDLGVHHGYLDEIAFSLADKAYYALKFQAVDQPEVPFLPPAQAKSVDIQLNIDSGTWDLSRVDRVKAVGQILRGRSVVVEDCNYYATVTLKAK